MTLRHGSYENVIAERDAALAELKRLRPKFYWEMKARAEVAEQQRDQLRKVLEKIEWVNWVTEVEDRNWCPTCFAIVGFSHRSDCALHAALTATGEPEKPPHISEEERQRSLDATVEGVELERRGEVGRQVGWGDLKEKLKPQGDESDG